MKKIFYFFAFLFITSCSSDEEEIINSDPTEFTFKYNLHTSLPSDWITEFYVIMKNLDDLLWKWKSPLSREWYPFLLGLKHDLQLFQKELTSERIIKTQTKPLAKFYLRNH